jgi:hypothetical protein
LFPESCGSPPKTALNWPNYGLRFAIDVAVVDNRVMTTPDDTEIKKDNVARPSVPDGGINDGKSAMAVLVVVIALIIFAVVKL